MITSASNPTLKLVRKLLAQKRKREELGLFAVEGEDLVEAAAAAAPLGWLATQTAHEARADVGDPESSYFLELAVWPGVDRAVVAACDFHGNWLEWRGL